MCGGISRPGSSGCSTIEKVPPVISAGTLKSTPTPPSQTDSPSPASTTTLSSVAIAVSFLLYIAVNRLQESYRSATVMSSEMSTPRTYELKQRAERQRETRRRIVDAAIELHTTVGPSRTTVSAIAERAGVTRPTVYAHFPDDRSLLEACSGHVRAAVPPPDAATWRELPDPGERLETALRALYRYYERLESLLENVQRDATVMPLVAEQNAYR